MGRLVQKRIIRKLDLEMLLSRVEPHPNPKPDIEQYTIPADVAATMLHFAAYTNGDIVGKSVLDLGCGTGRLALGAAFLGAKSVVGVDVDIIAIKKAFENALKIDLEKKVDWLASDVDVVCGNFDTVVQNPPYGIQTVRADRKFLEKALEVGKTIYSLHKSQRKSVALYRMLKASPQGFVAVTPDRFLERFVEKRGRKIKGVYAVIMSIPHMFSFHTKRKHEFIVDLYVIDG